SFVLALSSTGAEPAFAEACCNAAAPAVLLAAIQLTSGARAAVEAVVPAAVARACFGGVPPANAPIPAPVPDPEAPAISFTNPGKPSANCPASRPIPAAPAANTPLRISLTRWPTLGSAALIVCSWPGEVMGA